jgi:RNA polymerase sigma-70 factor (ECF subfamily)
MAKAERTTRRTESLGARGDRGMLERLSDAAIVGRVRAGETALFELIMRRYNRRLFRIARGVLRDDADAEDAVQDAYIGAYRKLHQFRGPDGFATWLCRIATNEALMRRRSRARAQPVAPDALDEHMNPKSLEDRPAAMDPEAYCTLTRCAACWSG